MKIYEICFSPTRGTRKAADILAGELSTEIQNIDLTDSTADFNNISLTQNDISVIAVPSYGGRVSEPAAKRISAIHGNGSRAILMCVYGNRAYEDTLAELQDVAKQAGFRVISAVAAIAEHSIARQFAAGRPDAQDQASGMFPSDPFPSAYPEAAYRAPRYPRLFPLSDTSTAPESLYSCVPDGLCF